MVTVSRIEAPRVGAGKSNGVETKPAWRVGVARFLNLPLGIWSRFLVLFVALAGIKVALVVSLGKKLFETHWRLTPHEPVWGDYVLFGFFVVIGGASLLRLQRSCALAGVKAIRAAN